MSLPDCEESRLLSGPVKVGDDKPTLLLVLLLLMVEVLDEATGHWCFDGDGAERFDGDAEHLDGDVERLDGDDAAALRCDSKLANCRSSFGDWLSFTGLCRRGNMCLAHAPSSPSSLPGNTKHRLMS